MRATITIALFLTTTSALAEERVEHRFESAAPRGTVRRVVVDVPAGDVTIRNGPTDRLAVAGLVSREPDSARNREKEQRIVNDISLEIHIRNDEAIIRRRFGPEAQSWRAQSFSNYDMTIELPQGLHVDVKTRAGDVTIDGSFGDVDVDLRAGEANVRLPRADVRELRASCRVGEVRTKIGNEITEAEGLFPGGTRYINSAGRTFVNVHVTAGEVNVELRE